MSTGAMTPTAMSTDAMPTGAMSSGAMSTGAMTAHGSYVTLADYTAAMTSYNGTTVVYYFSSASCAVCQQKDAGLMSNPGTIPAKVTIVKVDFDASTELKQKYGVAA